MSSKLIAAILLLVGLVNVLPVVGVLSAARLQSLYGIELADHDLIIMMRHRALLFGLLGAFLVAAAFMPVLRPAAFIAGFVSMLGFVLLAWQTGSYGASIGKVVMIDVAAILALMLAAGLAGWQHFSGPGH